MAVSFFLFAVHSGVETFPFASFAKKIKILYELQSLLSLMQFSPRNYIPNYENLF